MSLTEKLARAVDKGTVSQAEHAELNVQVAAQTVG